MEKTKITNWEKWVRIMETGKFLFSLATLIIVLWGVKVTIAQLNEISLNQKSRTDEQVTNSFNEFRVGKNKAILAAIGDGEAILKPKGVFTEEELSDYLNQLHGIGTKYQLGLLDEDSLCGSFYDIAKQTQDNKEIQNYILKVRNDNNDNSYYGDIDTLNEALLNCKVL